MHVEPAARFVGHDLVTQVEERRQDSGALAVGSEGLRLGVGDGAGDVEDNTRG